MSAIRLLDRTVGAPLRILSAAAAFFYLPFAASTSEKFSDRTRRMYHPGMRHSQPHRALSGRKGPWNAWWLWGIPVGLCTSAATAFAEFAREGGMHGIGAALDTIKVLIYAAWLMAAWRRAPNVEDTLGRIFIRFAVALGVVLVAVTS
jgi:hypothetical protein